MATQLDPSLTRGLSVAVQLSPDRHMMQIVTATTGPVVDVLNAEASAHGDVVVAFPAMVVRSDVQAMGVVVVFERDVMLAWRKGLLRKVPQKAILSRATMTSTIATSRDLGGHASLLLTMTTPEETAVVGLAHDEVGLNALLRDELCSDMRP